MSDTTTARGFVVIECVRNAAGKVVGSRLVQTRKRFPLLNGDQVAVQLNVTLPVQAFGPTILADVAIAENLPAVLRLVPEAGS